MEVPYFPVDLDSLEGLVTFQPVEENMIIAVTPEVSVRAVGLNHPNGGIGYAPVSQTNLHLKKTVDND